MPPILKRLCLSGLARLPLPWLQKRSPVSLLIPFHHLVSDEPVPYIESLYAYKSSRQFEADLDYLLRHFRPLSLQELLQRQQKGLPPAPPGKKEFLLCFDDGLRQVYETAAPLLLRKGVPAALFINPSFVDNTNIFYNLKKGWLLHRLPALPADKPLLQAAGRIFGRPLHSPGQLRAAIRSINYLNRSLVEEVGKLWDLDFEAFRKEQRPFMTLAELKELAARGFAIGAHSMDHPLYSLIPPDEQLQQTLDSVRWVTDTFSLPYKAFAFPHVDTGVRKEFFQQLVPPLHQQFPSHQQLSSHEQPPPSHTELDLVLGNRTGMLEHNPRILHRFIGENPAIPAENMVKAVLAYSLARQRIGRSYVQRS